MTNYKTEQEKQNKEFEGKFVDKVNNLNGDFAYEEMRYGEQQDVQELRDYLLTRDTALLEALKKDVGEEVDKYKEALIWCSGSDDFQIEGKAREGWEKICVSLLKDYNLNK